MAEQQTIYQILLLATPVLLAILGFIGALAVRELIKLSDSVNEIRITLGKFEEKHDNHTDRITKLEEKVFS